MGCSLAGEGDRFEPQLKYLGVPLAARPATDALRHTTANEATRLRRST
jgi:hypothetical protein